MWDIDTESIRRISGFSPVEQDELFRWFTLLPIPLRVLTLRLQGELARGLRENSPEGRKAESDYACLLMAAWRLRCLEEGQAPGNSHAASSLLREMRLARVRERRPKPSPRRELILGKYRDQILDLRRKGMSWRHISQYFRKYHGENFSHGYLRQTLLSKYPDPHRPPPAARGSEEADGSPERLPPI